MEMKQYLLDTFAYNDRANRQVLAKLAALPEKDECLRYFSHLINSQDKWMARINAYPRDPGLDWWTPVYGLDELETEWARSLRAWQEFLGGGEERALFEEVKWVGFDGAQWTAPLKDIALQLNYHSIHHRAQMQAILRAQGQKPDFVDYIGTVYRRLG